MWPGEDPAAILPVHMLNLRDQGLVQGQLWALDALAEDCAADGVYEFLLAATPAAADGWVRRAGRADCYEVIDGFQDGRVAS